MYYFSQNGETSGPISEADLQARVAAGSLLPTVNVWREGMAGWLPYNQVSPAAAAPPPFPPPGPPSACFFLEIRWTASRGFAGSSSLLLLALMSSRNPSRPRHPAPLEPATNW